MSIKLARFLGIKFESDGTTGTYGTDPDAGTPLYIDFAFTDIGDIDIGGSNEILEAPSSDRDVDRSTLGPYKLSGSVKTVADCYMLGYWLYGVLGTAQEELVETTVAYGHLFYPVQGSGRLPSWTMISGLDGIIERLFTGSLMKSLAFSASAGGLVEVSVDLVAQKEAIDDWEGYGTDPTEVVIDDDANLLSYIHGSITKIGGSSVPIEEFSVSVNNNIDEDWLVLGNRFLYDVSEQDRTVDGSLTISFKSKVEASRFFAGGDTPTATAPGTTYAPFALDIVFDSGTLVLGTTNYQAGCYMPEVVYTSYNLASSTRKRITYKMNFKALKGALTWASGTVTGSSLPAATDLNYTDEGANAPIIFWVANTKATSYAGDQTP